VRGLCVASFATPRKPGSNSSPAFLYLGESHRYRGAARDTMAHELHHIGLSTACVATGDTTAPASVRPTREWMGAFGEGLAMLAAAGGPDIHPHALDDSATRARWERNVANVGADVARVQQFFFDVLDERAPVDSLQEQGMSFFGVQVVYGRVAHGDDG